jgi:hypothetical protein
MTAPAQPRTLAANQARQQGTRLKLHLIEEALSQMRRERTPITYPAVARRAGVSRTFLYQNPDARNLMTTAITATDDGRRRAQARQDEQAEAAWRQRALNAEDALKAAYAEIGIQRQRIAILMGQVRELQAARSNNRFLDKRIAGMEARLLDAPLADVSAAPCEGGSQ